MMKKKLAAFLVAGMVCAAPLTVGAEAVTISKADVVSKSVTVTYTQPESYTVTIPSASVTLEQEQSSLTVSASDVVISTGNTLKVTVKGSTSTDPQPGEEGWYLKNKSGDKISYDVKKKTTDESASDTSVLSGGEILAVTAGTNTGSVELLLTKPTGATKADEYTGYLTFDVQVATPLVGQ